MKIISTLMMAAVAVIMLLFVGFYGNRVLLRQHLAESYPHVQGEVLSSQVTKTHGSKGGTFYHPSITYQYTVNGVEYISNHYRYDGHPTDSSSAYRIVTSHSPGSAVDVYYNPHQPGDSLLSPSVDVSDMNLFLFVTAMALFTMWAALTNMSRADWPWDLPKAVGGVKIIADMPVTRLRLPRYLPLPVAMLASATLMQVSTLIVSFKLLPLAPWVAGEWSLAVAAIGGLAVYMWQYMDIHSGRRDLVIDEGTRTVQLPLTFGRRERSPIPFSQIRMVFLARVRHQTKSGAYYTFFVTLEIMNGQEQKLINLNLARAQSLAAWLREKLEVAAAVNERALDVFEPGVGEETAEKE